MSSAAGNKTPISAKKPAVGKEKLTDSGKKLIQARLPFKLISSSPIAAAAATASSDDTPKVVANDRNLNKRALANDEDVEGAENVQAHKNNRNDNNKKAKLAEMDKHVIITVDDDDGDDNDADENATDDNKVQEKVQIKLPLGTKKLKRRKCAKNVVTATATAPATKAKVVEEEKEEAQLLSSDAEVTEVSSISLELNPQKRAKLEATNEPKNCDESMDMSVDLRADEQPNTTESEGEGHSSTCNSSIVEIINEKATINTTTTTKNLQVLSNKKEEKKPLTPKQLKLLEQRRQAREEKERKILAEKLQKQSEKEKREEAKKQEREQREEQRRQEREEKDVKRRTEREEKERKRQAEIESKNEEKRKRHEAKEEEMRKKEEERMEKDMKVKKAAEVFTKFFVPKTDTPNKKQCKSGAMNCSREMDMAFRPFQLKGAMKLAPVCRRSLSNDEHTKLDEILANENTDNKKTVDLYLKQIKLGKHAPIKWQKVAQNDIKDTSSDMEDDVIIIEDELLRAGQAIVDEAHTQMKCLRAKYYKFHENRRPPYYGTWRKKSKVITARRPLARDGQTFDYEVDSDLEWEEEEEGELLEDSDAEDDKDKESENDDYDVDNEWMVPHGHLSEEEMQHEDEFGDVCATDDVNNTREAQLAKLKVLQQEFAMEMKKKTQKIQPRLVGCIWTDEQGQQPATCSTIIWESLKKRAMMHKTATALFEEPKIVEKAISPKTQQPETVEKVKPLIITEKLQKDLVHLLHGNSYSKKFLIKEFLAFIERNEQTVCNGEFCGPLKSTIRRKIDKLAEWQAIDIKHENKKSKKRLCWVVKEDVLAKMGLSHLTLQNQWKYILCPRTAPKPNNDNNDNNNNDNDNDNVAQSKNVTLDVDVVNKPEKKRVPLLMSVARGQQIPTVAKNALISQFLKKNNNAVTTTTRTTTSTDTTDTKNTKTVDEIIAID